MVPKKRGGLRYCLDHFIVFLHKKASFTSWGKMNVALSVSQLPPNVQMAAIKRAFHLSAHSAMLYYVID